MRADQDFAQGRFVKDYPIGSEAYSKRVRGETTLNDNEAVTERLIGDLWPLLCADCKASLVRLTKEPGNG